MHSMREENETVEDAMSKSDQFVRKEFTLAKQLLSQGKTDLAYFVFGIGLHTIQDATSPAHGGFQVWTGHEDWKQEAAHVLKEFLYPGVNSNLPQVTST